MRSRVAQKETLTDMIQTVKKAFLRHNSSDSIVCAIEYAV